MVLTSPFHKNHTEVSYTITELHVPVKTDRHPTTMEKHIR